MNRLAQSSKNKHRGSVSIHTKNTVSTAAEIARNARQMINRENRGRNHGGGVRRNHQELSDTEGRSLALSSEKPYGKVGLMIRTT